MQSFREWAQTPYPFTNGDRLGMWLTDFVILLLVVGSVFK